MDPTTLDTYNNLAKEYDDDTADFWQQFPKTFFDKFISLVKGRVLDIGSGPGRDGLVLQQNGLDVVGLDASHKMVEISSSRGLYSVVGDFTNIPFPDVSFEGVWAYACLHHSPKTEISKAIAEVRRILKPDGMFGLGVIEGEFEGYRKSSGVTKPRWFSLFEKKEMEKILKDYGFEIIYFDSYKPASNNFLNFIARKVK